MAKRIGNRVYFSIILMAQGVQHSESTEDIRTLRLCSKRTLSEAAYDAGESIVSQREIGRVM
jgi:hypothetical protein